MGAWAVLACMVPRTAILALPWIWGPCSEKWAMRLLSTSEWHAVRYVMPMAAIMLAAGLIGYARLASGLLARRGGRVGLAMVWVCSAVICGLGLRDVTNRLASAPVLIARDEAEQIWVWIKGSGITTQSWRITRSPLPCRHDDNFTAISWTSTSPRSFPSWTQSFAGCSCGRDILFSTGCWTRGLTLSTRGNT